MKRILVYALLLMLMIGVGFAQEHQGPSGPSGPLNTYPVEDPIEPTHTFLGDPFAVMGVFGYPSTMPDAPYGILGYGVFEISGDEYGIGVFGEAQDNDGIGVYGVGSDWGLYTPDDAYVGSDLEIDGDLKVATIVSSGDLIFIFGE